jgi:hypothetical protein
MAYKIAKKPRKTRNFLKKIISQKFREKWAKIRIFRGNFGDLNDQLVEILIGSLRSSRAIMFWTFNLIYNKLKIDEPSYENLFAAYKLTSA